MSLDSDEWDGRTMKMAAMIPPGSRVLEFGAGRMVLRKHLPPGCTYMPADLVKRQPGTILCDLNDRNTSPLAEHDVAFFSGVLEYVYDIPRALKRLPPTCRMVIASYATTDAPGQAGRVTRIRQGWVNHYTSTQFVGVFARAGYRCLARETWKSHTLFQFARR